MAEHPGERRITQRLSKLVTMLRGKIQAGQYGCGQPLPSRRDLCRELSTGPQTLQEALAVLEREGFVSVKPRQGTYVVDHPPHLYRVGLPFPSAPGDPLWSGLWSGLCDEAERLAARDHYSFEFYVRLGSQPDSDAEEEARLADDLAARRLAGLIIPCHPSQVMGEDLDYPPPVPHVALADTDSLAPGWCALALDRQALVTNAVKCLANRGARRLAVLVGERSFGEDESAFLQRTAEEAGIACPDRWFLGFSGDQPRWVANATQLLAAGGPEQRPDSLLILDEALVPPALAGLEGAGCRCPDDLRVLAFSNFPRRAPAPMPITRIGFDLRTCLRRCLDLLAAQRERPHEVQRELFPPVFEYELPASA